MKSKAKNQKPKAKRPHKRITPPKKKKIKRSTESSVLLFQVRPRRTLVRRTCLGQKVTRRCRGQKHSKEIQNHVNYVWPRWSQAIYPHFFGSTIAKMPPLTRVSQHFLHLCRFPLSKLLPLGLSNCDGQNCPVLLVTGLSLASP